jgi:type IV secretion system protein VirB10
VPPERVRTYQRELAERDPRAIAPPPAGAPPAEGQATDGATPVDPLVEERRRREYESLFSDNVAFSKRPGGVAGPASPSLPGLALPSPQELAAFQQAFAQNQVPGSPGSALPRQTTEQAVAEPRPAPRSATPSVADGHRILEGTLIETVLLNRLDGTFSGPVTCLVTTPVYSEDRQTILIPSGARLLGKAAPVQTWGDSRLAVSFHRLVLPNGRTFSLEEFKGLNQIGETGLKDSVDRHYLQVFGASLAIGAISGLAQWGTRGGFNESFGDASRQSAGASLASSSGRVMERYLNVLPTVTIREGHRIKVYLTNDLTLPAFDGVRAETGSPGGAL